VHPATAAERRTPQSPQRSPEPQRPPIASSSSTVGPSSPSSNTKDHTKEEPAPGSVNMRRRGGKTSVGLEGMKRQSRAAAHVLGALRENCASSHEELSRAAFYEVLMETGHLQGMSELAFRKCTHAPLYPHMHLP
jgi:hypothetical protein